MLEIRVYPSIQGQRLATLDYCGVPVKGAFFSHESSNRTLKPAELHPGGKRSNKKIAYCLLLTAILVLLFAILRNPPSRRVVWLSQSEFNLFASGGRLAPLKKRFGKLYALISERYYKSRLDISFKSALFTLPASNLDAIGLGTAIATNAAGFRAWLLTPEQMKTFMNRLETGDGVEQVCAPEIATRNGGQAEMRAVELISVGGTTVPIGFIMDEILVRSRTSIKVITGAAYTELSGTSRTNSSEAKMSFNTACRALIPNGGTLDMAGGESQKATNKTFLVTATVQLIDTRGLPISFPPHGSH